MLGLSSKVSALTTYPLVLDVSVINHFLVLGSWFLVLGSWFLVLGLVSKLQKAGTHFNHALASPICKVWYVKTAIQMSVSLFEVS